MTGVTMEKEDNLQEPSYDSRKLFSEKLSDKDFDALSVIIQDECGIKMPLTKKVMLEARLRKRLRALKMKTFKDYCEFLLDPEGMAQELVSMIDVVTTNKTDFFREPTHFEFMTRRAISEQLRSNGAGLKRPFSIWSAGCSTGEEPYTIAMIMEDFALQVPDFDYIILATDISTRVLEKAKMGIYEEGKVADIPDRMKKKYLLRSKDRNRKQVRIVPELRNRIRFGRLNFMEEDFGMKEDMDMVFCRNVIIYFNRVTQEQFLAKLVRHLAPGGYLFVGHSETLHGMDLPLKPVMPSIYKKV